MKRILSHFIITALSKDARKKEVSASALEEAVLSIDLPEGFRFTLGPFCRFPYCGWNLPPWKLRLRRYAGRGRKTCVSMTGLMRMNEPLVAPAEKLGDLDSGGVRIPSVMDVNKNCKAKENECGAMLTAIVLAGRRDI